MSRIFYFEIHQSPSELLLPSAKKFPTIAEKLKDEGYATHMLGK